MSVRTAHPALAVLRALAPIALLAGTACNESDLTRPDPSGSAIETAAELVKRQSPQLVALVISPDTATLAPGASRTFSAMGRRKDGSTVSVSVRWSSTGGTVNSDGVFKAGTTPGTYRVIAKATKGSFADTARVTVNTVTPPPDPSLVSIVLTPASATLMAGGTQQFAVTGRRSDGSTVPVTPTYTAAGGVISPAGLYTAGQTAGSFRVIATATGGTIADTSAVTVAATAPPPGAASCLDRGAATKTITGTQTGRLDDRTGLAANAIIDARSGSWPGVDDYAVLIGGGSGWCWTGGRIEGFWDDQTSWSDMHGTAAFENYGGANTVVEGLWLKNYGDGWKPRITADNWTLRRSHFIHMRDDCLENDYERGGLVDDVFFEGCYSAFSARPSSTNLGDYSGAGNTWTIQNSLVWLEPMDQPYKGTPPNTSWFFKWDKSSYNSSPKLVLRNNIFRADMVPADGSLCLTPVAATNKVVESTNNVIVWLGAGAYPCQPIPAGWTLTTDRRVWDDAVMKWKAAHPGL
jgi:hypothetical protein